MHQRFPDTFTLLLTYHLAKALQPPSRQLLSSLTQDQREKEESSRISKQRTYLRIAVELWLAGVLRNVEDGIPTLASANIEGVESQRDGVAGLVGSAPSVKPKKKDDAGNKFVGFIYSVLYDLLSNDMDAHANISLVASFLKNYGQEILGIVPRRQRAAAQQHSEEAGDKGAATSGTVKEQNPAVSEECQNLIKDLIVEYYRSVEKHLVKDHQYIKKLDHRNRETLFTRGELPEDTKQNYEKVSKVYEKLLNNTQTWVDYKEDLCIGLG